MPSPHIPNSMQNHHHQQQQLHLHLHLHGIFRCSHCSSFNNICHHCSSFSSIYNLRYDCINCGKLSWTTPTGRQPQNSTTGNNRSRNRRLTFSAVSVSSFSTAASPSSSSCSCSSSSSSSPSPAAANSGPFSSMFRVIGPTFSNWVPQPSMLRPVVQIPRPPTLPQQQIPNINVQVFPRPPALPQQQNPNIGITMAKKPALYLELSLKPPERPSGTPQQRPLPFDLNMAPPDN